MATTNELERMIVRLVGDGSSYQKMLQQAQQASSGASRQIEANAQRATGAWSSFASSAAGAIASLGAALGVSGIAGTIQQALGLAAVAEDAEVAFGTMLRDADAGKLLVKQLQDLAAQTPLTSDALVEASRTLLQFGVEGKNLLPLLKMLGDVTGGDAERLQRMSLAFGHVSSAGRMMGHDLLMMVHAGFNPLQEMSRQTGKSVAELRHQMESGGIGVDAVVRAMQTATSEGGQFFGLMEKQSRTLGGLFSTLQDDVSATLRTIGKELTESLNLKGMVKDLSAFAQQVTSWLGSLSSETKKAALAVGVVTLAVGGLTAAIAVAGVTWNLFFGGSGILLGLVVTGVTAVIAALSGVVVSLGGLAATWDLVKRKAVEAWEWLAPIRQALSSFFSAVWSFAVSAFSAVQTFVLSVWERITGGATVNWTAIRDTIRDAILFAEFTLRNFGAVAEYVWTGAQLGFVVLADTVIHFFQYQLPAMLDWFGRNWRALFEDALDFGAVVFLNLSENISNVFSRLMPWLADTFEKGLGAVQTIADNVVFNLVKVFSNLPELVKGKVSFKDLWTPLTEGLHVELKKLDLDGTWKPLADGFARTTEKLALPEREIGALEKRLREDFDRQGLALGKSWEEFRAAKLAEFALPGMEEAKKDAEAAGIEIGKTFNEGVASTVGKTDAILFQSSEALRRVADYREKVLGRGSSGGVPGGQVPVQGGGGGAALGKDRSEEYLQKIEEHLAEMARKPPGLDIEAAGFA